MLRLLSDENFDGDIVRRLFLRQPNLDLLHVRDIGLRELDDPAILDWAATNERIVLTHDRATMPDFAYERLLRGEQISGLFVISDRGCQLDGPLTNYYCSSTIVNSPSGKGVYYTYLCKS